MGVILLAASLGLLGGALVPMVVYRLAVPIDAPVRGECVHCDHRLPAGWRGWLPLPCDSCGKAVGPPLWTTSLVAAVASGLVAVAVGPSPALVAFVPLAVLGVTLGAIDIAVKRLPHALVQPATIAAAGIFLVIAAATAAWGDALRALLGALALGGAFLVLYLLPGAGLGYGDVKLAVLLGIFLGWLGWREVILGALLPWLVNAPVVGGMLLTGRAGRKTKLPFGPAMLLGALLAMLLANWVEASVRL